MISTEKYFTPAIPVRQEREEGIGMAYQALYRQWRPKNFSQMVGQEAIIEALRNQVISGRIAHAYLFCGSRGTGKTSTAKILAKAINCEHPGNGDPCGECEACRRMEAEESLDIMEIDAASNNSVDDIRELRDTVQYPPQFGRYKVYIVDEVHMLSNQAFNALLKTLEEPPAHVVFMLATTEPQKLPATILSRCQRFDFGRIPAAQMQGRLLEAVRGAGREATPGALMLIARAAEGGMRDALSILDMCIGYGKNVDEALVRQVLGTSDRAFLFRFSSALAGQKAAEVIAMIDELIRTGRDPLVFSKDVSAHFRALLMARLIGKEIAEVLELTEEDAEEYIRESESMPTSRLMDLLDRFMSLETDLRYAGSPRIALENTALKCCLRTEAADTLAISDRMAELENRLTLLADQIASGAVRTAGKESVPSDPPGTGAKQSLKETAKEAPKQQVLTPTGRGVDEIWKTAVRVLQKTEPSLEGMLKMGMFAGSSDGTTFHWQASPGNEFFVSMLNKESRKGKIIAALTEAAGFPCNFTATDMQAEIRKTEQETDEANIQPFRDVFGSENVSVQE